MADRKDRRRDTPEDRPARSSESRPSNPERASPVPGPGTEGAEEGYHSMHAPEERRPDTESYNVAPGDMPPSPAGANADIGGEAAASRRLSGLPPDLAERPGHRSGGPTPGREPILGYDGLAADDVVGWIYDADPGPDLLHRIRSYEAANRRRDDIMHECRERIRRFQDG